MNKGDYVLITGVCGFIGMSVAENFLTEGYSVVGIDNFDPYYDLKLKEARLIKLKKIDLELSQSFLFLNADVRYLSEIPELESLIINGVIHLAAQAGVRYSVENPRAYFESNILAFQEVIDFVRKRRISKFLYASSSSVYGKSKVVPFKENFPCLNPESYYGLTKRINELMAESYFRTYGIGSYALRFFTVYGPWGRPDMAPMLFANSAFSGREIQVFNNGEQQRDFTYIDDVVKAIFILYRIKDKIDTFEIFNIGHGSPIYLMEFISLLEKYFDVTYTKNYVKRQVGDVDVTYADSSKLQDWTGFTPEVSLETGLKKFVNWYKEYYNAK